MPFPSEPYQKEDDPIMNDEQLLVVALRDVGQPNNERLRRVLGKALEEVQTQIVISAAEAEDYFLAHSVTPGAGFSRLLFVIDLGADGINLEYQCLLRVLRTHPHLLDGWLGGVIIDATTELYTKSVAQELVFTANMSGCAFVGRSLVEGTGSLRNFTVTAHKLGTDDLMAAYTDSACGLVRAIMAFAGYHRAMPKLTVLHASNHKTSNTFALWHAVSAELDGFAIEEIGLRNGAVQDCSGCPYKTCLHFGEKESCFYGGIMVENVYPSVKSADAIVMICPNYNDAISANLTAFINRLTALYRKRQFYDKAVFACIVSGYSGCDILAKQLIAALNMNKSFYLPGHFALMAMANDPGSVMQLDGIDARVREFAHTITRTFRPEE